MRRDEIVDRSIRSFQENFESNWDYQQYFELRSEESQWCEHLVQEQGGHRFEKLLREGGVV